MDLKNQEINQFQLKILYPNLFHVTCIAHLLHNCALQIKSHYDIVDNLIAKIKSVVVKNKERKSLFDEIGTPPQPIVTRWASWLRAAFYYAENFPRVKRNVEQFEDDGLIVERAKNSVREPDIPKHLTEIYSNYKEIAELVPKIESQDFTIAQGFEMLSSMNFGKDPCQIQKYITRRLKSNEITSIIHMSRPEISPMLYALLKKCQPTTASVERSFSQLKHMLTKPRNFLPENVEKYFIIYYNNDLQD